MENDDGMRGCCGAQGHNRVLDRVLGEVRAAECGCKEASTTAHMVYVSGVFETTESTAKNQILDRVLSEVRASESSVANTTAHMTYVSGVFEKTEG